MIATKRGAKEIIPLGIMQRWKINSNSVQLGSGFIARQVLQTVLLAPLYKIRLTEQIGTGSALGLFIVGSDIAFYRRFYMFGRSLPTHLFCYLQGLKGHN